MNPLSQPPLLLENLGHELRSRRNELLLRFRNAVAFRREGYAESGDPRSPSPAGSEGLEKKYAFSPRKAQLAKEVYDKNLATLFILEKMLSGLPFPQGHLRMLEPGCQDFSRLPAIHAFFRREGYEPFVTGLEIDAYPLLNNLHSRADKAGYYVQLEGDQDLFQAADFFTWDDAPFPLILSFYPFVSTDPALAWGLPKKFGQPELWVRAFERNLLSGGQLLVVHQGEWEQEEFDDARTGSRLKLVKRENVDCPFYPLPHPACASVYTL